MEERKEQLEHDISRRSAGFYTRAEPATLAAVRAAIPARAALIEIAVYRPFDPRAGSYGEPHYVAYVLRFDGNIPATYYRQMMALLPMVAFLRLLTRFPLGVHLQLWRFVSLREVQDLLLSVTLGTSLLLIGSRTFYHAHIPWGVLALDWGVALFGLLALRGVRRAIAERQPFQG